MRVTGRRGRPAFWNLTAEPVYPHLLRHSFATLAIVTRNEPNPARTDPLPFLSDDDPGRLQPPVPGRCLLAMLKTLREEED